MPREAPPEDASPAKKYALYGLRDRSQASPPVRIPSTRVREPRSRPKTRFARLPECRAGSPHRGFFRAARTRGKRFDFGKGPLMRPSEAGHEDGVILRQRRGQVEEVESRPDVPD